jgi:hypothetical protein
MLEGLLRKPGVALSLLIVVLGAAAAAAEDDTSPWTAGSRGEAAQTPLVVPSAIPETVGGAWVYGPETPFAFTRFDGGYSPLDGKIYFLGGRLSDGSTDGSVWSFNPRTGAWADTGDDLPIPISNYQVSLYEHPSGPMMLALCGRQADGTQTDAVQFYNVVEQLAGQLPPIDDYPGSLSCVAGLQAVWHNKVIVAAGFDNLTPPYHPTETWLFDPDLVGTGGAWAYAPTATLTPGRAFIMSAVVDDLVYAIGGAVYDGSVLTNLDIVQRLDPSAGSPVWVDVAPLPEPCSSGRAWGFDSDSSLSAFGRPLAGSIITTCGFWSDENNHVYLYDTRTDTWEEFPFLLTDRRDNAAEYIPATGGEPAPGMHGLWVWGGRQDSDDNVLTSSEVYELEPSLCSALLVNDDPYPAPDGGGGLPYYTTALDELGVAYDVWDVPAMGSPSAAALAPYDAVIWFTGYDYTDVVNPAEQEALTAYLDGGGTLLLSAEDQYYAHGLTPLLTDYLWIAEVTQDVQLDVVEGNAIDPLYAGVAARPLEEPIHWGEYWPGSLYDDAPVARPGGFEPLFYPTGGIPAPAATRYDGGHFRTMFMGFPVEWVRSVEGRADLLGPMLRWAICPLFVDGLESGGTLRWSTTLP